MKTVKFFSGMGMLATLVTGALALSACTPSSGDSNSKEPGAVDFPTHNIDLYLGYAPGGSADPIAREYAKVLGDILDVNVTVQNRPGGSGAISTTEVLSKPADGYTIALAPSSQLAVTPLASSDALTYSGPDDWTTIGSVLTQQNGLMVRGDSGWKTLDDFIAAAKAKPGELIVGVSSATGSNAMGMASLQKLAGIEVRIVPFEGGAGEAAAALLAGKIHAQFGTLSGQLGQLKSGDFVSLGHAGHLPYTPANSKTFAEQGYDITSLADSVYYAYGPKGIPDEILRILSDAHQAVIAHPDFVKFLETNGYAAKPSTPEEGDQELRKAAEDAVEGVRLLEELELS